MKPVAARPNRSLPRRSGERHGERARGGHEYHRIRGKKNALTDLLTGYEPYFALGLLLILFAGFMYERFAPDVTAAGAAALFVVFGLAPTEEVLAAFANPAPITIAAMFIISGALVRTGLLDALANRVIAAASHRPLAGTAAFLLATLLVSALMNNTPVVLVLIPAAIRLAQSLDLAATRLLIPLSYVAVLGGTCTLIGSSTNLLGDGVARETGMEPFSILEITPVGLIAAATGGLALLVLGLLLLPDRRDRANPGDEGEATF